MRRNMLILVLAALVLAVVLAAASCGGVASTTTAPIQNPGTQTTLASAGTADGKAVYAANCATCHGADLKGDKGPALLGRSAMDLGYVETRIKFGVTGGIMPAFKDKLTDEEIASVANYILKVK
jgi:mono/diheme cytochrome c family protein